MTNHFGHGVIKTAGEESVAVLFLLSVHGLEDGQPLLMVAFPQSLQLLVHELVQSSHVLLELLDCQRLELVERGRGGEKSETKALLEYCATHKVSQVHPVRYVGEVVGYILRALQGLFAADLLHLLLILLVKVLHEARTVVRLSLLLHNTRIHS